jgi:hypothetical protein
MDRQDQTAPGIRLDLVDGILICTGFAGLNIAQMNKDGKDRQEGRWIVALYLNSIVTNGDIGRLAQPWRLVIYGVTPIWSVAMHPSAADTLSGFHIEVLPPDRDQTFASDASTCPCCRKLRPVSSMDKDGCRICDECLAP